MASFFILGASTTINTQLRLASTELFSFSSSVVFVLGRLFSIFCFSDRDALTKKNEATSRDRKRDKTPFKQHRLFLFFFTFFRSLFVHTLHIV